MTMQSPNASPEDDLRAVSIGPRDVVSFVLRYKFLIGLLILAGAVLGGVVAYLQEPLYRSEVVLQPRDPGANIGLPALAGLGGLSGALGIPQNASDGRRDVLAILESRQFNENFINKYGLMPHLFKKKWDADEKQWRGDVKDPPTIRDAFRKFDKEVRSILEDRERGLITIRIDWHDRELASRWANDLAREADGIVRAREIREAEKNLQFLREQLEQTPEIEVRQSVYELMEAEIKRKMVAQSREYFVLRLIDPATIEDEDAFISPKRPLAIVMGATLGLIFAFGAALIHASR